MSVAEKARQLDIFNVADMLTDGRVDPAKAAASWGDLSLGVGTLHDVYAPPALANDIMAFLINASAAKVPPLVGGEATHGLQGDGHTIFPSPIGLAATFDAARAPDGGIVGAEARASACTAWAPCSACAASRAGGAAGMMGEDAFLAGALGAAAVDGLAARNLTSAAAVAPLLKHFAAYSTPGETRRARARRPARAALGASSALRRAFDAGAQAVRDARARARPRARGPRAAPGARRGAPSARGPSRPPRAPLSLSRGKVMCSYNEIDGDVNAASKFLLTTLPSGRWRGHGPRAPFEGYVSSDFGAIHGLQTTHRVATSARDAIARWLLAGGAVQGFDFDHETWRDGVRHAVASGRVPLTCSTPPCAACSA